MSELFFEDSAPANIALIKYMGKTDASGNGPANSSFSYVLESLRTFVSLEFRPEAKEDSWLPLQQTESGISLMPIQLSESGQARFLKHLQFLKDQFKFAGSFLVRSGNSFPSDCGLASSASSFAALTKTAVRTFSEMGLQAKVGTAQLARLSQAGSGSSCRSVTGPWVLWTREGIQAVETPYPKLHHLVILVENKKKEVSSSEAHRRVPTSLLFLGRPERAEVRLRQLLTALDQQNWRNAFEICWTEFWDMHGLFETASPPFRYLSSGSLQALEILTDKWKADQDGPLVTMDAGANIHLLFRPDQEPLLTEYKKIFDGQVLVP